MSVLTVINFGTHNSFRARVGCGRLGAVLCASSTSAPVTHPRAQDSACDDAIRRKAFGKCIGEHEGVGFMLANHPMDLHMARLTLRRCAQVLNSGELGLSESRRVKVIVSEAVWCVADRCVQILRGQGVTGGTVVARTFADMRAFRIYDGPSEVHRWSLAKRMLNGEERR
jgi:acyl-CoA dehydrogenase